MRKSTLFISAALTTFMLAVMFGVVSAYQKIVQPIQALTAQVQPTQVVMASLPVPAQTFPITAEAAAALASKVMNRTDLFSAEVTQLNGVDCYLVTFSSGDLVYVGIDGQILSIGKTVLAVVNQPALSAAGRNTGIPSSASVASSGAGEHEGGDD